MNYGIYVIKPSEAGNSPFVFQAPNEIVAIKTMLCSTVNLQNGQKLYDYNFELIDTGLTMSPSGDIHSPLISKRKVLGSFDYFYSKIHEYNLLAPSNTNEEVKHG